MLQHVSIEVAPAEVERMVEFWEAIGFSRVEAPGPIDPYVTWLEREGTQIHLIHTEEPTVPSSATRPSSPRTSRRRSSRVAEAGFEVEEHRELWGKRRSFAIGPGGHRVELMEAPPPPSA